MIQNIKHYGIVNIIITSAKSLQFCLTLCNPMDYSPLGSSAHGTLQLKILAWVAISSSRASSWLRDQACVSYVSCTGRRVLYHYCHLGSPIIMSLVIKITSGEGWEWPEFILLFPLGKAFLIKFKYCYEFVPFVQIWWLSYWGVREATGEKLSNKQQEASGWMVSEHSH